MIRRFFRFPGTVLICLLVLLLWAGALLLSPPAQTEPFRVAVGMWPGAEPWILARTAEELEAREINLIEMNWTSAAMRAVGNRVVDAAVLSLDEVARLLQQGYPLKIVMVTDVSHGADALMVKPDIRTTADLKGRRIGYEPRTSGSWLLNLALRESGLTLQDIEPVPLNPSEVEEIFQELSLDGVVTNSPWKERLGKIALHTVFASDRPEASIIRVLAVHADAVEPHRQALRDMLASHFRWMPRLREPGAHRQPVLRREALDDATFARVLDQVKPAGRTRNLEWLTRRDSWLADRLQQLLDSPADPADSGVAVTVGQVLDPSLLEELP